METDGDRSDEELVAEARRASRDDTRAFEQLVERHQHGIAANCRYMSGSAEDARDLTQEVFVKAFFGLPGFDGRAAFRTWLYRVKVNHCLNHLRRRKGRTFLELDDPSVQGDPGLQAAPRAGAVLESLTLRDRIGAVLDRMSDTLRIPLLMRDLDGYTYQEIADELELGVSAVKMRIKRGREEFRRLYAELGVGAPAGPGDEEEEESA